MFKKPTFLLAFATITMMVSCTSDDTSVDCTSVNLAITISSQENPTCGATGSVNLSASGGVEPYTFTVVGAGANASGTFEQLSAGAYSFEVTDKNACTASVNVNLTESSKVELTIAETKPSGCESNGSVSVTATGGKGAYTFAIDGGTEGDDSEFTGLAAGAHTILAKDENGCFTTLGVTVMAGTSLETAIMPIINQNCGSADQCHGSSNTRLPVFENNPTGVIANADKIQSRTGGKTMPPSAAGGPLSDDLIATINCWVNDGALNN